MQWHFQRNTNNDFKNVPVYFKKGYSSTEKTRAIRGVDFHISDNKFYTYDSTDRNILMCDILENYNLKLLKKNNINIDASVYFSYNQNFLQPTIIYFCVSNMILWFSTMIWHFPKIQNQRINIFKYMEVKYMLNIISFI